ncbi:MAG: DEAD/DEAH box helicase [Microthrixaceae bacterium]
MADGEITVVAIEVHGDTSATLTYRTGGGQLGERILVVDDLAGITEVSDRRWTFDADGASFRLASEARRMKWAHLADPFAAVDTSNIEPYPHQIDAVYNRFLEQKPLRFLLADDPGAGKTIMAGLLIRELMLRGDVARCLIVAPGSLVEQWQDELWEKFGLDFEIMSRAAVESSRTGNPFLEKNLLVARVDQLSRAEDLLAKLQVTDWDLVIVDEAHKMSAHQYGNEMRKTKRFILGEVLRDQPVTSFAVGHTAQREERGLPRLHDVDRSRAVRRPAPQRPDARRQRCDAPASEGELADLRRQAAVHPTSRPLTQLRAVRARVGTVRGGH